MGKNQSPGHIDMCFLCCNLDSYLLCAGIDVDDQLNPGRRVVYTLYVNKCRPGLGCSLMSIVIFNHYNDFIDIRSKPRSKGLFLIF